jgi:anti-sigma regulatory factor (Ser/Thr protein kinase)
MSSGTDALPGDLSTVPWLVDGPVHDPACPCGRGWTRASLLELAALPTAVPCGRLHTRLVLGDWGLSHIADDAEMLVSELLTNAVKAAWQRGEASLTALRLLAAGMQLLIEVWDQSPDDPRPRQADADAENGRGFRVVEAIGNRWGFRRVNSGLKVVWCELVVGGQGLRRSEAGAP